MKLFIDEDDFKELVVMTFKDFKESFRFPNTNLAEVVNTTLKFRSHIENAMSENFFMVTDAHKKHQWLNQKLTDILKINSIMMIRHKLKEQEDKKARLTPDEKEALNQFIDKMKPTASDKTDIVDTTQERQFHEVANARK